MSCADHSSVCGDSEPCSQYQCPKTCVDGCGRFEYNFAIHIARHPGGGAYRQRLRRPYATAPRSDGTAGGYAPSVSLVFRSCERRLTEEAMRLTWVVVGEVEDLRPLHTLHPCRDRNLGFGKGRSLIIIQAHLTRDVSALHSQIWTASVHVGGHRMSGHDLVSDVNLLATFLASEHIKDINTCEPIDCVVICVSQIFAQAEKVFAALEARPDLTKTLVLVGGIGHSTQPLYDAVARHPRYRSVATEIAGLPESRVLETVMYRYFDVPRMTSKGCQILIEDQSTNCGANATMTGKVLEHAGVPIPRSCVIVQDPTMMLRSIASFQKVYERTSPMPQFLGCPVFVPQMHMVDDDLKLDIADVPADELWTKQRFFELLIGEIPRLRDDESGYGPKGKGFIVHVDVPGDVEKAWQRVHNASGVSR